LKERGFPFTKVAVRFIARILFLLLAIILLAGGAFLAIYNGWRADRLEALAAGDLVAPQLEGDIQFAMRGSGPPILVLHGTPGGYDQGLLFGEKLVEAGFTVIAPSRPGYLETGLGAGLTPEDFARSLAFLLDSLDFDPIGVLAVSGGAPAAIELAAQHPELVAALALVSPVTERYRPRSDAEARGLFGEVVWTQGVSDVKLWFLQMQGERNPLAILNAILAHEPNLSDEARTGITKAAESSPEQSAWLQKLLLTLSPLSARDEGVRNDIVQFKNLRPFAWQNVTDPVLLIRGVEDADLPVEQMQKIADELPNADLLVIENAGHLPWLSPKGNQVDPDLVNFFSAELNP